MTALKQQRLWRHPQGMQTGCQAQHQLQLIPLLGVGEQLVHKHQGIRKTKPKNVGDALRKIKSHPSRYFCDV